MRIARGNPNGNVYAAPAADVAELPRARAATPFYVVALDTVGFADSDDVAE